MEENNFEISNETTPVEPNIEAQVEPVEEAPIAEQPTVEEAPVVEEAPAEPVAEPAPVEPPVEPAVEQPPVVEETPAPPVEPAPPVAPAEPATPVAPAEPAPPVQPQAPVAPQGVVEQPPQKKGGSIVFILIVVILILAICGLGIGLIVLAITNANINANSTTTTTTTTVTAGTSTIPVTTIENTTTIPRTTRSGETPTPTSIDDTTIKVGYYNLPIPTGYQVYKSNSTYPIIVNKTKKVQLSFYYNGGISYSTIVANPNKAIGDLQKQGCTVIDATSGVIGTRGWMLFLLDYPGTPEGYQYIYGITSLSSGIMETAMLLPKSGDIEGVVTDINGMLDKGQSGSSSFAPSIVESEDINSKSLDDLDSRIFE